MRPYVRTLRRPSPAGFGFPDTRASILIVSSRGFPRAPIAEPPEEAEWPIPEAHPDIELPPAHVESGPSFQPLLEGSGELRTVSGAEFAALLDGQVAEPSQRHVGAQVRCRVQVYEVLWAQRIRDLAADISRRTGRRAPLARMTPQLASRLGLTELPAPPDLARNLWREPDVALPFERFVQLLAEPAQLGGEVPAAGGAPPENLRGEALVPTSRGGVSRPSPVDPDSIIPEAYRQPWQLVRTREEVLIDMATEGRGLGVALAPLRWLASLWGRSARLWRWDALLAGKGVMDQLWGVRPPPGGLRDRAVRAWARRALIAAGLDPQLWLREWEIFWRQRGL